MTKGDTNFPKNIPNLNHTILSGVKILYLTSPKIKKIKAIIKDQTLTPPVIVNNG